MQIGPLGDSIFYILASFWSRDSQVRKSPPCRKSLKYSHTHTHTYEKTHRRPTEEQPQHRFSHVFSLFRSQRSVCAVHLRANSVAHLLRYFVRVEDARHGHLQLVFLLLGLTQRRLPLLQEQIRGVLTRKFLQVQRNG